MSSISCACNSSPILSVSVASPTGSTERPFVDLSSPFFARDSFVTAASKRCTSRVGR